MSIYVPSRARSEKSRTVLDELTPQLLSEVTVVVPEGEGESYLPLLEKHGISHEKLVELPLHMRIQETRVEIGKLAAKRGEETMVMLDDDINFSIRRDPGSVKLYRATPEETEEAIRAVEADLVAGYAHASISAREGNNRIEYDWIENQRYIRVLAYRVEDHLRVEHRKIQCMEDFDVALQLLKQGRPCKIWFKYAQGQPMTQAAGGCSVWRTHQVHEGAVIRLAELHPGLVRLRTKRNKTDKEGFGTRTEATISWKKAAAMGGYTEVRHGE